MSSDPKPLVGYTFGLEAWRMVRAEYELESLHSEPIAE
jgi:hypothetical protein